MQIWLQVNTVKTLITLREVKTNKEKEMSKLAKGNRPRIKNGKNNLGLQSVIHGIDNNPAITAADPKAKFIAKKK
jgi:hypothetical protein